MAVNLRLYGLHLIAKSFMTVALDVDVAQLNSVLNVTLLADQLDLGVDLLLSAHLANFPLDRLCSLTRGDNLCGRGLNWLLNLFF